MNTLLCPKKTDHWRIAINNQIPRAFPWFHDVMFIMARLEYINVSQEFQIYEFMQFLIDDLYRKPHYGYFIPK